MSVRLLPLGGLGEVGMNALAIEDQGAVLLVDCGVTFDDRNLGVDLVFPDFEALGRLGGALIGVVVTHGHEDHIGALPFLLKRHDIPVYAPRYAGQLLRERVNEFEVLRQAHIEVLHPREQVRIGPFVVEPIRVTHSIVDATAVAIRTSAGTILHSGDFKFDPEPPDGELFDEARVQELGDQGISLLLSDSTNIDSAGEAGSEELVRQGLDPLLEEATGAVVISLFASNVHRLKLLGELARAHGRRIVLLGRGVQRHARVARSEHFLKWASDLVLPESMISTTPREKLLVLATGSQGEARAALSALARGNHSALTLVEGDTVILSSRVIPGHELDVSRLITALLHRGVRVHTRTTDPGVHVSGHAHREEQRRMIRLARPQAFLPVHGTLHHLTRHAELARSEGVPCTLAVENGTVVHLGRTNGRGHIFTQGERIPVRRRYAMGNLEVPEEVLLERQRLAIRGVVLVSATLREQTLVDLAIRSIGLVGDERREALDSEAREAARRALSNLLGPLPDNEDERGRLLSDAIRRAVRKTYFDATGVKSEVIVHLLSPTTVPTSS